MNGNVFQTNGNGYEGQHNGHLTVTGQVVAAYERMMRGEKIRKSTTYDLAALAIHQIEEKIHELFPRFEYAHEAALSAVVFPLISAPSHSRRRAAERICETAFNDEFEDAFPDYAVSAFLGQQYRNGSVHGFQGSIAPQLLHHRGEQAALENILGHSEYRDDPRDSSHYHEHLLTKER